MQDSFKIDSIKWQLKVDREMFDWANMLKAGFIC